MSGPWWTREAGPAAARPEAGERGAPVLVDAAAARVRARLVRRIPAYTAEWTNHRREDAGVALVRLFGDLAEPVLARANSLPEVLRVEQLRAGGVDALPPSPARALLTFEVDPAAPGSVLVPEGFQVGAAPAGGGESVVFETRSDLWAAPGALHVLVDEGGVVRRIDDPARPSRPLGDRPGPGHALLIGLEAASPPGPSVRLGAITSGLGALPPPASAGGLTPLPIPPPPLLRWQALVDGRFVDVECPLDDTASLTRSGVAEVRVPRPWGPGRPVGLPDAPDAFWLRLRLVAGRFAAPPSLDALVINAVEAEAGRTIRDEVLEPLPGRGRERGAHLRLQEAPVVPDSLVLEVAGDGLGAAGAGDVFGTGDDTTAAEDDDRTPPVAAWSRVEDLAAAGPTDHVYTLDPATGELAFGDGWHGAVLPRGFRNVRAVRYRLADGAAGSVPAGAIGDLVSSAGFVTGASNPRPARGGADAEPLDAVLRRGPHELRARRRAVAPADYGALALRAPGARIARAHAYPGRHPARPERRLPGVVGVVVVPPDDAGTAPQPSEPELRAVCEHLSARAAPAGVEILAFGPRYLRVQVEAQVQLRAGSDAARALHAVARALDEYLHPLRGGDDGGGWPFDEPFRYARIVRRALAASEDVVAVPSLCFVADGRRHPPCADLPLGEAVLPWPGPHELIPIARIAA